MFRILNTSELPQDLQRVHLVLRIPQQGWPPAGWREHSFRKSWVRQSKERPSEWFSPFQQTKQCSSLLGSESVQLKTCCRKYCRKWWMKSYFTWKTVTVAQRSESKFFLSQTPVRGSQNMQPNSCIPRILTSNMMMILMIRQGSHLNMKMNKERRPKKTTTLSMVLSMTTSCLWRPGKNLTSLSILNSLNVLKTVSPEPSSLTPYNKPFSISTPLSCHGYKKIRE